MLDIICGGKQLVASLLLEFRDFHNSKRVVQTVAIIEAKSLVEFSCGCVQER